MFLVVFFSGPMMIVSSSATAKNLVPKLLANSDVRQTLSTRILDQVANGAEPLVSAVINSQRKRFIDAISAQLSSPATVAQLQKDVVIAYDFVATNQPTRSLDIRPLIDSLISAMSQVNPLYAFAKPVLKGVKPITLTRSATMPNIGKWVSFARYFYLALIILLATSLFFFFKFAASARQAVRGTGIRVLVVGIAAIVEYFVLVVIADPYAKTTSNTLTMIVPVAVRVLFSYYLTLGIAMVVIGAIAMFISTRMSIPRIQIDQQG